MYKYLIRIVLKTPSSAEDYARLHALMENAGAQREIRGDDGYTYRLPPAEYYLASSVPYEQVRDRTLAIASAVDVSPDVLVTQAMQFAWQLPRAA